MVKTIATILGISISLTVSFGCQDARFKSDAARLKQIMTLYDRYARFPQVKDITVPQLQQRQQGEKIVLVDVRSPEERAVSMIPGAISQEELERCL